MRIVSLHVLKWDENTNAWILKNSYELSFLSFYQRPFMKGHLNFGARTAVSRIQPGQNVCVGLEQDPNVLVYAAVKPNKLAAVCIADKEYPDKVAIKICHDIMKEFEQRVGLEAIANVKEDQEFKFDRLDGMVKQFQDPKECDKLMKIEDQ